MRIEDRPDTYSAYSTTFDLNAMRAMCCITWIYLVCVCVYKGTFSPDWATTEQHRYIHIVQYGTFHRNRSRESSSTSDAETRSRVVSTRSYAPYIHKCDRAHTFDTFPATLHRDERKFPARPKSNNACVESTHDVFDCSKPNTFNS